MEYRFFRINDKIKIVEQTMRREFVNMNMGIISAFAEGKTILDPNMREFKMNERFDLEHHALNRHDRRRIKAEYRKKRRQL